MLIACCLIAGFLAGFAACVAVTRWALRNLSDLSKEGERVLIAECDELRMKLSATARRADNECMRRKECEAVIEKIRRQALVPADGYVTITKP